MAANKKQNFNKIPKQKELIKIGNYVNNKMDKNDEVARNIFLHGPKQEIKSIAVKDMLSLMGKVLSSYEKYKYNDTTKCINQKLNSNQIKELKEDDLDIIYSETYEHSKEIIPVCLKNISMFADKNEKLIYGYYRNGHPDYEMPNDIMEVGNQYATHVPIPNNDNGNDEEDTICKFTSCAIL